MEGILRNIPIGKCRVVEVSIMKGTDARIDDFPRAVAIALADEHNRGRNSPLDSVYWVYDDTGHRIRCQDSIAA